MHLHDLKWPEVAALRKDTLVILPVASLEQHGRHLPVGSSAAILSEILRRAERRLGQHLLVLPMLWLGDTTAHAGFPGTLGLPTRLCVDLLASILDQIYAQGFRQTLVLNASRGNEPAAREAIARVRAQHDHSAQLRLHLTSYQDLPIHPWHAAPTLSPATPGGHACEWQTSMAMRLLPEHSAPVASLHAVTPKPSASPTTQPFRMADHSSDGHLGDPSQANAVKGEVLLQAYAAELIVLMEQLLGIIR